ncbi:AraC family transcriptional activator of pobA [Pseudochelatococcus lubricantis]|uniref:AraC family transcriptional activator of pobA n=1 Tax=Pseudochelatococcus lubricantis TaxID=1538102 RepID=A0ABX0V4C9_9HYPH|nr:helix-turn-helix domain-containing protein [Pseudochelatococcus lubricantis]NIJ59971.1 AraC family transcriptional activator of pobA [Pseudochelatococcus lubricantis]
MLSDIPTFFVYGESARPPDVGFLHVETVMARKYVHFGKVEPHRHDSMAQITFWTKGHGSYLIEDKVLEFSAPAVSFIPSGIVHGFTVAADDTDAIVISVADSALPLIAELALLPLNGPAMVRTGEAVLWRRLARIMDLIMEEYAQGSSGTENVILPQVAVALAQIARLAAASPALALSPQKLLAIQLRQQVDLHFRDNWPVGRYVEQLRTTPHLLAKACEASFGMQIKELIVERRLLEAKRLLLFTIRSVEDIAFELGMKDAAYFSRFFRARTGAPPGRWRQRQDAALGGALDRPVAGIIDPSGRTG